ncbi:cubilin-like [Dendronephthya gigantea]|uniref:cubilin-like n=1 Tax=Dendronephthya gigantea TaxID=151771 RepID=UPI001069B4FC|nr:cubilin-like [Dendronephthya gigantea]
MFTFTPSLCGDNHLYTPATLQSPLYPRYFPNSIDCNWTISDTNGSRILLTFLEFALESRSGCIYDYLDVYDGDSSYAQKLGRYCGNDSKLSLTSSGSHLFIALHSDGIIQKQAFVLNFSNTVGLCGDNHLYTPATLKSPLYPRYFPNSIDCNWTISDTNGSRILLTFSTFVLESHSSCKYDYLDVYDGDSSYAQKLGRYCGNESKLSLTSSGSHLFIAFHSDGIIQKQAFVLNFSYTVGRNVTICTKKIDLGFVMDSSGSIGRHNFEKTKSFIKYFTDYFKISPNETRVSVITFATRPTLHFGFSREFRTRQDLYLAIDKIPYNGGKRNTAMALLNASIDMFHTQNGARISGIKRILIVLTAGKSTRDVHHPSQKLKNLGVVIFSIGVGSGIDVLELEKMASSPAKDHVFLIDNFNEFADLAHNMSFNACNGTLNAFSSEGNTTIVVIAVVVPTFVLLAGLLIAYWLYRKRRNARQQEVFNIPIHELNKARKASKDNMDILFPEHLKNVDSSPRKRLPSIHEHNSKEEKQEEGKYIVKNIEIY